MSATRARLEAADNRWTVSGPLLMDSVAALLEQSAALALPAAGVVDLSNVDRVDSAGVALLLAWKRRAAAKGMALGFAGMPQNMTSLAELYGVGELLRQ